jgi:hypothetical protein
MDIGQVILVTVESRSNGPPHRTIQNKHEELTDLGHCVLFDAG